MPWPVRHAGVIGGGTMGSGIAISFADAGLEVTLVEVSDAAVKAAEGRVRTVYDRQVKGGRLAAERRATSGCDRIRFATDLAALADCDLVVEAVIEDLPTKQDVFRRLSGIVRRDAVLASNTSYLDINLMADVVDAPERVLGLHFFSPAHVMRLLEIVRAGRTAAGGAGDRARARQAHRQAAGGRRASATASSATASSRAGASNATSRWRTARCRRTWTPPSKPYGLAMGPYAVADLAGLDIGFATRKRLAPTRDPKFRYVPIADWICELGRFGQKTGAGYYLHQDGKRVVDPAVTALVERASAERGITRHPVAAEDIQQRVHAAMVDEAARILGEGIARRPSDIDVVLVHGYGYPAWRGGPMHEADADRAPGDAAPRRGCVCRGWTWARTSPATARMVQAGKNFADLNV